VLVSAEVEVGSGVGAGCVRLTESVEAAPYSKPVSASSSCAVSPESLPAKSGSIMAWASRMSCRKTQSQ